jgi:hypothetical protein
MFLRLDFSRLDGNVLVNSVPAPSDRRGECEGGSESEDGVSVRAGFGGSTPALSDVSVPRLSNPATSRARTSWPAPEPISLVPRRADALVAHSPFEALPTYSQESGVRSSSTYKN